MATLESASAAACGSDSSRQRSVPPFTAARASSTRQTSAGGAAVLLAGADAAAVGADALARAGSAGLATAGGTRLSCPPWLRTTSSTGRFNSRLESRTMRSSGRTSASVTVSRSNASRSPPGVAGLSPAARPGAVLICPFSTATRPESLTLAVGVCSKAIVKSASSMPLRTRNGRLSGK